MKGPRATALALLFGFAACGGRSSSAPTTERDSAGVHIVESYSPQWTAGERWHLASKPVSTLGAVDGDTLFQFHNIVDVVKLSSGEIVVANGGTSSLRWFSASGVFLRTVGRSGGGPGEFRSIRGLLRLRGDTLLVHDGFADRVTIFDAVGQLVRTWPIEPAAQYFAPGPVGQLSDGRFVAVRASSLEGLSGHLRYVGVALGYQDGTLLGPFAEFAGGEGYFGPCGTSGMMCNADIPFGLTSHVVVMDDAIVVGDGNEYRLDVLGADGRHRASHRVGRDVIPVTDEMIVRYVDSMMETFADQNRPTYRRLYQEVPRKEKVPAFVDVKSDENGNIWVRLPMLNSDGLASWDVLDTEGRWLGSVSIPAELQVRFIGSDTIIGTVRDDLGVEYVRVYELVK